MMLHSASAMSLGPHVITPFAGACYMVMVIFQIMCHLKRRSVHFLFSAPLSNTTLSRVPIRKITSL